MKRILIAKYGAPDRPVKIGNIEIPCYVLEDGRRVIVQRGLYKALGLNRGGVSEKYKAFSGGGARIVRFLHQNKLIELNSNDLLVALESPIVFKMNNVEHFGYEATILQEIVRMISKTYLRGQLPERHASIGQKAEILDDAFAKIGIIALIDEATGYQYDRPKDDLNAILAAYIAPELLPWTKKFPDAYYEHIFRLNGWVYSRDAIKKRPGVVGRWTNKFIYEQLPNGVLDELKANTPKSAAGNYTARFFQGLTIDTGHPHLNNQLMQIIALMKVSDNWEQFKNLFEKMLRRNNGESELPFNSAA